jgi:hypothetical protein
MGYPPERPPSAGFFGMGAPAVTRAVRYAGAFWFGVVILVLFTGSALCFGGYSAYENYLFDDHARHVVGRVDQKYITTSQSKSGTQYHYHVAYSYDVDNLAYHDADTLSHENWDELSERGAIPIKYLPEKPGDNRIDNTAIDYHAKVKAWFGLGFGLLVLVVGGSGAITTYKRNKLVKRLRSAGISCQGRIISMETERVGKATMAYARFEFTDSSGRVVEGRTWPMSSRQENQWSSRRSIPVFYDPANSNVFTVEL